MDLLSLWDVNVKGSVSDAKCPLGANLTTKDLFESPMLWALPSELWGILACNSVVLGGI